MPQKKWDVFISHAFEDKPFVDPLVQALTSHGMTVWYDKLVLEWGDDLRSKIDNGLLNCRYGIVVLSKAFLGKKKWTEYELNSLFALESDTEKVILPIWHEITQQDLLRYSPALADRLAKVFSAESYEDIAKALLQKLGRSSQGLSNKGTEVTSHTFIAPVMRSAPRNVSLHGERDLNPKEVELMWNAIKDPNGEVLHMETFDGESIRTNGIQFLQGADTRTAAKWRGALRRLETRGFIEARSDERYFFQVTAEGYEAENLLEGFQRWNAQFIVMRANYFNAPFDECKFMCKGIMALPALYYPDDVSADGARVRSLRERRALLVEEIFPKPLISWIPNEVEFLENGKEEVEQFLVDGMEFIPPASAKLPIVG